MVDEPQEDQVTQSKLDFVSQFMNLIGNKLTLLPTQHQRELLDDLEALFLNNYKDGATTISDAEIIAIFDDHRRQAFVEQVRRAIGSKLKDLSPRQKDLLDASLTKLYRENRPVSDAEIQGRLELVTDFVSPAGQEQVQKAYWDLRLNNSETGASQKTKSSK
jgi:hypothetical protein